jgi:hypothetical protein
MPRTGWTPSIARRSKYVLVVDDFGRNERVYRETELETADLETVILDLLNGQYRNPTWTPLADIAHELMVAHAISEQPPS